VGRGKPADRPDLGHEQGGTEDADPGDGLGPLGVGVLGDALDVGIIPGDLYLENRDARELHRDLPWSPDGFHSSERTSRGLVPDSFLIFAVRPVERT
jgi:hypothetical protein